MADSFEHGDVMRMRLNGTVCMYKGKPVMVLAADNHPFVSISSKYFKGQDQRDNYTQIEYTDPDFDYYMPPIGFVNYIRGKEALYFSRKPVRQYKQGLCAGVLTSSMVGAAAGRRPKFSVNTVMSTMGFHDMLMNIYPEVDDAVKVLGSGNANTVAISKTVALGLQDNSYYAVYHKTVLVGAYNKVEGYVKTIPNTKQTIIDRILMSSGLEVV